MRRPSGEGIVAIGVFTVWLMSVVLSVAVTVGLVYAAFHFIAKYW